MKKRAWGFLDYLRERVIEEIKNIMKSHHQSLMLGAIRVKRRAIRKAFD